MIQTLYIKITENCNLHCSFCYIRNQKNKISVETALSAIQRYKPRTVVFHGGEPFLYPEIISDIMSKNNLSVEYSITTNMTLPISNSMSEILDRCGVATSYSSDRFVDNEAAFKQFLFNCNHFKNDLTLLVTLSEAQLSVPVSTLLSELRRIRYTNVSFERLYPQYTKLAERTDEYLLELCKAMPDQRNNVYRQMKEAVETNTPVFPTTCDTSTIVLNPDGSTQRCTNDKHLMKKRNRSCLNCEYYRYCRGDCLSFRDSCYFPKKTFSYVLHEKRG